MGAWWHITHVDCVESANINSQLHCRRTKHDGKKAGRFSLDLHVALVLFNSQLVIFAITKTVFSPSTSSLVNLSSVLASLEGIWEFACLTW
jgi:hypothetical protein